jgi:GTPase SAR1 family protein
MRRAAVGILGVGGMGKTTFVYRLLGASLSTRRTLRPGIYLLYLGGREAALIDVPGQAVEEVARNLAKVRTSHADFMIYTYDVTDHETLYKIAALHSILPNRGAPPFKRCIVVGNKMDLAEQTGVVVETGDVAAAVGAAWVYYISALRERRERLAKLAADNLP